MTVPFIAPPVRPTDGDYDAAATAYGEAYADHRAAIDAAAGLPPSVSAAARPARVQWAATAALDWWTQ